MQIIFAFLAAAACIALSMLAAARLSARERLLNQWEGAFSRMEGALAHAAPALPELLEKGAEGQIAPLLLAAKSLRETPARPLEELAASLPAEPLLTPAEWEVIVECLGGLSAPSAKEQARALAYAREQWALFRRIGREAREKNTRLYSSLGWLAGAAVFILLC